jgi:RNA polymerase sigma-70 factor, ECF subfamily
MADDAALIDAWRAEHPGADAHARADADAHPDEPALGALLRELVTRARAEWPALALAPETFVRRVARHWPGDEPLAPWLGRLRAGDLYLACACEARVPGALETFDRELMSKVPAALKHRGAEGAEADEICQRVRERLFVGAAKIADYSGRGALANWLEVVALRLAIDVRRQQRMLPVDTSGDTAAARLAGADPELELIKEHYRESFKQAFRVALGALSSEQRNLLKLHFVDDVTLDQMAALFRVHRATVARRIAAAREAVLDGVHRHLQAELAVDRAELDSLMRLVRSRIDISLTLLFRDSLP